MKWSLLSERTYIFVHFAISNSRPFDFSSASVPWKYKTKSKNLMFGSVTLHLPCNNGFPLYDIQFTFMILPGCRHRTFRYSFGKVNFKKKYGRHTCSISLGPSVKPCQSFLTCFCYLFYRSFASVSLLPAFITIHSFPLASDVPCAMQVGTGAGWWRAAKVNGNGILQKRDPTHVANAPDSSRFVSDSSAIQMGYPCGAHTVVHNPS